MRSAGKFACLFLFLLILIFPLSAETPDDEELSSDDEELSFDDEEFSFNDEELSFFEEFPLNDEYFFFEEIFMFISQEYIPGDETFLDEETLLSEETFPDEEPFFDEEGLLAEDDASPDEELFLSEETFTGEETFFDEETLLAEEGSTLDEDDLFDIDALFFESSPLVFEVPTLETRSLDEIFPNLDEDQRMMALDNDVQRHYFLSSESPVFVPSSDSGIDLFGSVMKKKPSHLIEALVLVPYDERELDLLDIYNALGRIEKIKDQWTPYRGGELYVFPESTRIVSSRNRKAISDPLPAVTLPFSETMYIRLKEYSFGNLFIRGDMSLSMYGITYSMTNFTDVRYFLVPIMKAERFNTIIYLEPVKEGLLIYSMTGFYLPGFIADRVNLTPSINRRINVFIDWITDGLQEQENAGME